MKQADIRFTYQDYLLLSDDKRYELLEGELYVVPAPKIYHQRISRNLGTVLLDHIRRHDLGEILFAPCDVVLSHENVVQPDLLFVAKDRLGILPTNNIQRPPHLLL